MNNLPDIIKNMNELSLEQTKHEKKKCNSYTERFGITLTDKSIEELLKNR